MNNVLNQNVAYEKYFEEICQCPHNSYREQPLSRRLTEFAQEHGLKYKQDPLGNVIIYKNGTYGMEEYPPVILQSHIDMICEKKEGVIHDFEKDPLKLAVKDGWIYAEGTTLGADDGAGVAYMMAVLEDKNVKHPPLECLFTVQEEVGCMGAANLCAEDFKATRLLGLDEVSGDTTTVSGAGMKRVILSYHAEKEAVGGTCFRMTVGGLTGGHSGDDIHLERGNAIKLAGRFLAGLLKTDPSIRISCVDGGSVDNAICRNCTVVFASDKDYGQLKSAIGVLAEGVKEEYKYSDPGLQIDLEFCGAEPVFSAHDSFNIIRFLFLCPDGFRHKSMHLALTTASSNLGIINTGERGLTASFYIRGAAASFVDTIADEILILGEMLEFEGAAPVTLPCWEYKEDSPLRNSLKDAFYEIVGREMKEHAEHGCLEAGHFTAMKPGMDIATLGPLIVGYHTTDERMNRASFGEIYQVLIKLLEKL